MYFLSVVRTYTNSILLFYNIRFINFIPSSHMNLIDQWRPYPKCILNCWNMQCDQWHHIWDCFGGSYSTPVIMTLNSPTSRHFFHCNDHPVAKNKSFIQYFPRLFSSAIGTVYHAYTMCTIITKSPTCFVRTNPRGSVVIKKPHSQKFKINRNDNQLPGTQWV